MCFAQMNFWALLTLFFHEKRLGHFRPAVCSWEGETNCLNVSSCETIRLQGCCQGCFWHLAKSLRAILFLLNSLIVIGPKKKIEGTVCFDKRNNSKISTIADGYTKSRAQVFWLQYANVVNMVSFYVSFCDSEILL